MPRVEVPDGSGIEIYYQLHGLHVHAEGTEGFLEDPRPRVLMLMGFQATHAVWAPQLADLLAEREDQGPAAMTVCCVDNRGVGRSGAPPNRRDYSTAIMALDALAVMDHLGWQQFHVVGHSMGAMISMALAAAAPRRVLSLSILSATAGGWQALPRSLRSMWLGLRMLAALEPAGRAAIDVRFHFSSSLLAELDPDTGQSRAQTLIAEYVEAAEQAAEQPAHGMRGQLAAVFRHRLRRRDVEAIQSGKFPCLVIHGREDIIAQPRFGRRLAARLGAPYIQLEGGHFVMREQAAAVNALLRSLVLGKSFANVERYPFMPFKHWVRQVHWHRRQSERRIAAAAEKAQEACLTPGPLEEPGTAVGQQAGRLGPFTGGPSRWWRPHWRTRTSIGSREGGAQEAGSSSMAPAAAPNGSARPWPS